MMQIEQKLWREAEALLTSPSHDKDHSRRVISYGLALQKIYGGDPEIITAAGILHDLGRADPKYKGEESAVESVRRARPILEQVGLPRERIDIVCQVIVEHDQPGLSPSTVEGQILKEADFLDGFGARGILRSLVWSGERGESTDEALERLRVKMPARIASLQFPESKREAQRQYRFVEEFLSLLEEPAFLE